MYITFYANTKRQISFEDLYNNFGNQNVNLNTSPQLPIKITKNVELTPENINYYRSKSQVQALRIDLQLKTIRYSNQTIPMDYTTFSIPKRSGGFRTIEAPNDQLKDLLTDFKKSIEITGQFLAHNAAYAYVQHRSIKDVLEKHKESNWFLKLDIHGFFPNCNYTLLKSKLKDVYPIALLPNQIIDQMLQYALHNDHLPQGTPLSPLLTNIIMVPFDTELSKSLSKEFIYTRYADDILISSKYKFDWQEMQTKIQNLFKELQYPFELNTDKTRFGSINGRNWNLGLMLNKNHEITLGYQKKQRMKAAIFNFCNDLTNGRTWDKIDVQVLQGQLAYGQHIEPDYFKSLIQKYEQKFHINFAERCKQIINA